MAWQESEEAETPGAAAGMIGMVLASAGWCFSGGEGRKEEGGGGTLLQEEGQQRRYRHDWPRRGGQQPFHPFAGRAPRWWLQVHNQAAQARLFSSRLFSSPPPRLALLPTPVAGKKRHRSRRQPRHNQSLPTRSNHARIECPHRPPGNLSLKLHRRCSHQLCVFSKGW